MPNYVSKRAQQDAQRDALVDDVAPHFPELSALWEGDGTLEVATVTLTRAKDGEGCLAIVKGTILPESKDYALVEQFGGRPVLFYGFGPDLLSALASVEVLLRRGEVSIQPDRYGGPGGGSQRARKPPKAKSNYKGD